MGFSRVSFYYLARGTHHMCFLVIIGRENKKSRCRSGHNYTHSIMCFVTVCLLYVLILYGLWNLWDFPGGVVFKREFSGTALN
jgi:hypothetical protein